MNPKEKGMGRNNQTEVESAELDHILVAEEELVPSSGFLASVMERVEEEAAAPAPIPFPWKRAIPGILLAAGVLSWSLYEMVRVALPSIQTMSLPAAPHLAIGIIQPLKDAGWVALALVVSLVSSLLSQRLAGRRGLL